MVRFLSFSSGSSGNCYYLESSEGSLLIDAGIGVRAIKKKFKEHDLDLSRLKGLIVTHEHADHFRGVASLVSSLHIPVFSSELTFRAVFMSRRKDRGVLQGEKLYSLSPHEPFFLAGFEITPFYVPHDCAGNMGYYIKRNHFSFALVTDVGSVTSDILRYLSRADHLVLEANYDYKMLVEGKYPDYLKERVLGPKGHLGNKESAELLSQIYHSALKNVWLCHLSKDNNLPELCMETFLEVLSYHNVNLNSQFSLHILPRLASSSMFVLED